jgi:transcriptional regulator with XRE-family HTH domain
MGDRELGRRLREARLAAGLSQLELQDVSGIPKARVSRYENDHVDPSLRTLGRLARALNVNEATLLGDGRDVVQEFFLRLRARGITIATKAEAGVLADRLSDLLASEAQGSAPAAPSEQPRSGGKGGRADAGGI